jgi:SAM-dependent methyltransferase
MTQCPLCGGTGERIIWREHGFEGWADPCGVVCMQPTPPKPDLSKELHTELYYQVPAPIRLRWVQQFKQGGDLLEVGCGYGSFLKVAQANGFCVTGLEPESHRASYCREALAIETEQAWIEELQTSKRYDVVFHVDLISHFPDPLEALQAMGRLLKPDGVLCFEVGVLGGMSPLWYRLLGGVGYPQHIRLFSKAALLQLFDKAGFDVVALRSFNLTPTLGPLILRHLLGRLLHRRLAPDLAKLKEPGNAKGAYRAYFQTLTWLRYSLGRWLPDFGPLTLFVTLKPKDVQ